MKKLPKKDSANFQVVSWNLSTSIIKKKKPIHYYYSNGQALFKL